MNRLVARGGPLTFRSEGLPEDQKSENPGKHFLFNRGSGRLLAPLR